jgi:hypothetical protein
MFDGEGATFQLAIADLARKLDRIATQDMSGRLEKPSIER